jgi:hypothetical protein
MVATWMIDVLIFEITKDDTYRQTSSFLSFALSSTVIEGAVLTASRYT